MKNIVLTGRHDGRGGFKSDDIRVLGAVSGVGSTSLCFHPDNIAEHGFKAREGKLDEWVLFAVQHASVIDNYGGSAAERERMTIELVIGEPFTIDGLRGTWKLVDRDRRRLEGDGYKPVPYEEVR